MREIHPSWPLEQLSHLSISLPAEAPDSVFAILERAKELKALELWSVPAQMIAKLPDQHLPGNLEHLTLSLAYPRGGPSIEHALEEVGHWLGEFRSLRIQHAGDGNRYSPPAHNWLRTVADSGLVEYLDISDERVPMGVLTEVVLKCRVSFLLFTLN